MNRKRILALHPSNELYGADRVLIEILAALKDRYELKVWLPVDVDYPEKLLSTRIRAMGVSCEERDLPVVRRKYANVQGLIGLALGWFRLGRSLSRDDSDVLYVNTAALAAAVPLGRLLGKRVIFHLHENLEGVVGSILGYMAGRANQIIAVSDAVRVKLPGKVALRADVIHNGFDIPARPLVPSKTTSFLLASRWNTWKGHKFFLSAWDLMQNSDSTLVILGGPPAAGVGEDVEGIVSKMRRRASVTVVGEVDDVGPYIGSADYVVVPSREPDPLPTIAIESIAAGRQVVATSSGGLPDIVANGTGWLLPVDASESEWAAVLDNIAGTQPSQQTHETCRRHFEQHFSRPVFIDKIRILAANAEGESTSR